MLVALTMIVAMIATVVIVAVVTIMNDITKRDSEKSFSCPVAIILSRDSFEIDQSTWRMRDESCHISQIYFQQVSQIVQSILHFYDISKLAFLKGP